MLPAPTTTAVSTPSRWTLTISCATASIVARSIPYSRSPMSDSPDSFKRMRRNTGRTSARATTTSSGLMLTSAAQLEPLELEHLRPFVAECLLDLLRGVMDPLLVRQHVGAEESLVQHALDDLLARLLGLRLHLVRAEVDLPLLCDRFFGNVVATDPAGLHRCDVHRDLAAELLGSASELQEDADLVSRRVGVRGDARAVDGLEARRARDDDVLAEARRKLNAFLFELRLCPGTLLVDDL